MRASVLYLLIHISVICVSRVFLAPHNLVAHFATAAVLSMPLFQRKKSHNSSSSSSSSGTLDFSEIKLGRAVGAGRSGSTYSAQWNGRRVAAKVVDLSAASKKGGTLAQELLKEFHKEEEVASALRHPNIVQFLGSASSPPRYCLVFEFMEGGTLSSLIRAKKGPLDFFRLANDMAQGMGYLHEHSVMHRDLKSSNVLLDAQGTAKISDFGLSCVLELGRSADLTAETGTYGWMAPEVIRHEPYSSKADVYSFGVVLWELLAKDIPFKGQTPMQSEWPAELEGVKKGFLMVFLLFYCSGHGCGRAEDAAGHAPQHATQDRRAHRALLEPGPDAPPGLQRHRQGAAFCQAVAEQDGLQELGHPLHGGVRAHVDPPGRRRHARTALYIRSLSLCSSSHQVCTSAPCLRLQATDSHRCRQQAWTWKYIAPHPATSATRLPPDTQLFPARQDPCDALN
jgi:serine/threonine protein kinase